MDKLTILFLCRTNAVRSQFGEALLKKVAPLKFNVLSAGVEPDFSKFKETGGVDPDAIKILKESGYYVSGLKKKSWEDFKNYDGNIDFVFTLSETADRKTMENDISFPGNPVMAHWFVEDVNNMELTPDERFRVLLTVFTVIRRRIELFVALPLSRDNVNEFKEAVEKIGTVRN